MKWVKICALMVLTLSAMRAGSWAFGWLLAKFTPVATRAIAVASNCSGFVVFVLLLSWDMSPGEPLDLAALLFGLVVFAVFCESDFYWRPWKPQALKR